MLQIIYELATFHLTSLKHVLSLKKREKVMTTIGPLTGRLVIVRRLITGLVCAGIGIVAANYVHTCKENKAINLRNREAVRDSFNLSANEFDILNQRVKARQITWQSALDSLKNAKLILKK